MPPKYKNPGRIEFDDAIKTAENGGSFVEFPHEVEKVYGVKGRVPVNVTFDGIPYRGSMVRMGSERHLLLILKEIRERLGKGQGDTIHVTVDLDEAPRVIVLARDVEAAFKKAGVLELFRSLSFSHQREYHRAIEEARQAETRRRRIDKAIVEILSKKAKKPAPCSSAIRRRA
jgi:bifunctional DNA-binding transcriptional regulator/antitoxin component of YhaV-PrlF toxin-antitoxin module